MAKSTKPSKKLVIKRKRETVREKIDKTSKKNVRSPRIRSVASKAAGKVTKAKNVLAKEYHPIKTGNSKVGKKLSKKGKITPSYFVQSYRELRQVNWPTFRAAMKLTFAVFAFAFALTVFVFGLDFGFDKLFKDVILK